MQQLSEQAQKLIDDFKRDIYVLPIEEREAVIRKMTESIATLNEDVKGLFNIVHTAKSKREGEGSKDTIDNIRDFI